jgi:hypothetical protein
MADKPSQPLRDQLNKEDEKKIVEDAAHDRSPADIEFEPNGKRISAAGQSDWIDAAARAASHPESARLRALADAVKVPSSVAIKC